MQHSCVSRVLYTVYMCVCVSAVKQYSTAKFWCSEIWRLLTEYFILVKSSSGRDVYLKSNFCSRMTMLVETYIVYIVLSIVKVVTSELSTWMNQASFFYTCAARVVDSSTTVSEDPVRILHTHAVYTVCALIRNQQVCSHGVARTESLHNPPHLSKIYRNQRPKL